MVGSPVHWLQKLLSGAVVKPSRCTLRAPWGRLLPLGCGSAPPVHYFKRMACIKPLPGVGPLRCAA